MPKMFSKAIKTLRKKKSESDSRGSSDKETEETFHIKQLEKDVRTLKDQNKLEKVTLNKKVFFLTPVKEKHRETKGLLEVAELCNKQLYDKLVKLLFFTFLNILQEKEERERLALEIEVQMLKEKLKLQRL